MTRYKAPVIPFFIVLEKILQDDAHCLSLRAKRYALRHSSILSANSAFILPVSLSHAR